jgi:hypothetical protein
VERGDADADGAHRVDSGGGDDIHVWVRGDEPRVGHLSGCHRLQRDGGACLLTPSFSFEIEKSHAARAGS